MSTEMVFLCAFFTSIPICVRYLLAFKMRSLIEEIRQKEKRVKIKLAELKAIKRECEIVRKARAQVETQKRWAQTRLGRAHDELQQVRQRVVDEAVGAY
jgi:DNA repair exonuclease SbcCD ATPase subunit